jgi:hypothetical protein
MNICYLFQFLYLSLEISANLVDWFIISACFVDPKIDLIHLTDRLLTDLTESIEIKYCQNKVDELTDISRLW